MLDTRRHGSLAASHGKNATPHAADAVVRGALGLQQLSKLERQLRV